jgi:DNA-binding PadR family transcriptional regulator
MIISGGGLGSATSLLTMCLQHIVHKAHMADRLNVGAFLPLTPVSFEILLALKGGEQHGYGMMLDIERRTAGAISLHAGSLYRALNRLLETGLIEELDERIEPEQDDERRRYYRLTAKGLQVARAEARRLALQVEAARERKLLPEGNT